MNDADRQRLKDMYQRGEGRGYPDPLDLLSLLNKYTDLSAEGFTAGVAVDFWEMHAAWEWLRAIVRINYSSGKHEWQGSEDIRTLAEADLKHPVSPGALIAAALFRCEDNRNKLRRQESEANVLLKLPPLIRKVDFERLECIRKEIPANA